MNTMHIFQDGGVFMYFVINFPQAEIKFVSPNNKINIDNKDIQNDKEKRDNEKDNNNNIYLPLDSSTPLFTAVPKPIFSLRLITLTLWVSSFLNSNFSSELLSTTITSISSPSDADKQESTASLVSSGVL